MKLLSCPVSHFLHNKKTDSSFMLLRYATKMVIRGSLILETIWNLEYEGSLKVSKFINSEYIVLLKKVPSDLFFGEFC
jgi:hypothetical protein